MTLTVRLDKDGMVVIRAQGTDLFTMGKTLSEAFARMALLTTDKVIDLPQLKVRRTPPREHRSVPVSRQRLWQLAQIDRGLCRVCGCAQGRCRGYCDRCADERNRKNRQGLDFPVEP